MSNNVQTYTTRIFLNSEEAKKQLDELEKRVEDLRKKKEAAAKAGDWPTFNNAKKQLDMVNKEINSLQSSAQKIDKVLGNMSVAGIKELQSAIKAINKELESGSVKRGSEEWNFLNEQLKRCKNELRNIRSESKDQEGVWQRFFKFLNTNWGAFTQIVATVTGLSVTIRKAVKDFAEMEEAMADTRKYTGLTDVAVRELNDDLKKMDTRTSREKLNELAGAAGRLGKTSKQDILDFVEAGNMIKVALGDDLGEGAIDKVGKLAMAFGEDEKMGLRGAMLATGSAVNELAQNSSAQAGYLVDFTARVAGFGKQLGLTQAQIMGFGAVMDENLLRDEMAATAFGNMLTKMQTDTEKFAKIAGMEVKEFTDLLSKDANAAILALADSLKKADSQTMMTMLDDMGLDGNRAVGVLSTLADKIDDVRERQNLATEAYREASSVGKEYATMNNTVEAEIEKCKKRFNEMAVDLGEKLLPIVKYAISSTALVTKGLSAVLSVVFNNISAITKLSFILAEYVALKKLQYLWTQRTVIVNTVANALDKAELVVQRALVGIRKAHTLAILAHNGVITKTVALQRLWNEVLMKNPVMLAVTAIILFNGAVWKLSQALSENNEKQRIANDLSKKAAEKAAEEKAEVSQLLRVARDEREQLDKRKEAIEKLNSIIPGYNGQLDETTGKYTENAIALKNYNTLLMEKYRLEAAEDKLKDLEKKRFKQDLDYEEKLRQSQEREAQGGTFLNRWAQTQGPQADGAVSEQAYRDQLKKDHEKQNKQLQDQIDIVTGIRDRTKEVVEWNKELNQTLENQRKVLEGDNEETKKGESPTTHYESDEDKKKRQAAADKAETERKKKLKEQADAAKASYNEQIAEEMLAYRQGITTYSDYLEEKHNITQNYYERLKAIYGEDSVEYRKQLLNKERDEDEYTRRQNKRSEQGFLMEKYMRELSLQKQFNDQNNREMFQNEDALNEALFKSDRQYMLDKASLYKEGSKEREEAMTEIHIMENEHRMQLEQEWMTRLSKYRQDMGKMDYDRLQEIEIAGVHSFYDALVEQGEMTKEEVDAIIAHIKMKYAELKGKQTADSDVENKAASALDTAKKNAGVKSVGAGDNAATGIYSIVNAIQNQQAINDKLKEMRQQDLISEQEYQEAKRQLNVETMQNIVAGAQAAYNTINSFMTAASAYFSAAQEAETAQVKAKYEKQIAAAGNNQKRVKKLQEKQAKEEAAIKSKYNKRAVNIQIAQAIAQTAIGALNAYSSAAAIPIVGTVLAPIAAAAAVAAGMIQVAAIKKQAQAQEAGYYSGGYTGGRQYRKEAGVVHQGEFVANHQAVDNPNVRPMLDFIDKAQRNNTVGSLTAEDISRQLGQGGSAVVTPIVNIQNDNEEMRQSLDRNSEATEALYTVVTENGIKILFPMDSFDREYKHFTKLNDR